MYGRIAVFNMTGSSTSARTWARHHLEGAKGGDGQCSSFDGKDGRTLL